MTKNLAKYMHYPEMKTVVNQELDSYIDKSQLKEVFTSDEIKGQSEQISKRLALWKKSKKPFSQQNQLKAREDLIKQTHTKRIQLKKDQNILLSKIKSEEDKDKIQSLMQEYIQLNQRIKEDYETLLNSNKIINPFLIVEDGTVTTHESTHKESVKKSTFILNDINKNLSTGEIHKTVCDKLKRNEIISRVLRHFIKKDTLTYEEYIKLLVGREKKHRDNWKSYQTKLQMGGIEETDKHRLLISVQYSINSSIIEEPDKKSDTITITKPWKQLLIICGKKHKEEEEEEGPEPEPYPKFKRGDQVEWTERGKQETGTIDQIVTRNGKEIAEIRTSDGKDTTKAISAIKLLE